MSERLNKLIENINQTYYRNYTELNGIFDKEYGSIELDPLRDEICKCIILGLTQASITLTNHLFETSLKRCLINNYSILNKDDSKKKFEEFFKDGIIKYDKIKLFESINFAFSEGLITESQKEQLHIYRKKYRNPFSHASSQDIFGDYKIKGKIISNIDELFLPIQEEISVKEYPVIQGILQSIISTNDCLKYFKDIDEIIRHMLLNIGNKSTN